MKLYNFFHFSNRKPIINSECNDKYLVSVDQSNVLLIWDLVCFTLLKTLKVPTMTMSDSSEDVVYSMKFNPNQKNLLLIALESGDLHELNIANGEFMLTFFINFGFQPSFSFDDHGYFLISFDSNLKVFFYKKDINGILNLNENDNKLDLTQRPQEKFLTFKNLKKKNNSENCFPDDLNWKQFKKDQKKDLTFYDLRQSVKPVKNKLVLSLKVLSS